MKKRPFFRAAHNSLIGEIPHGRLQPNWGLYRDLEFNRDFITYNIIFVINLL